ncbi:hypothetical protein D7X25_06055 [bacterium 1XD42-8]|nr:hypothetical protein D7X25_06055 [bacterium 1XD42-8]
MLPAPDLARNPRAASFDSGFHAWPGCSELAAAAAAFSILYRTGPKCKPCLIKMQKKCCPGFFREAIFYTILHIFMYGIQPCPLLKYRDTIDASKIQI